MTERNVGEIKLQKREKVSFFFKSWCAPVFHFLIPVVDHRQILVKAVVGGVAGRVVDDGGVPAREKTAPLVKPSSPSGTNTIAILQPW